MSVVDAVSDRTRRRLVWLAPVAVVGIVLGGVAIGSTSASGASPSLPARTPAQLIAAVAGTDDAVFSGVVSETANLGLPSLPGDASAASLSWQTFVTGSHSARVWVDGAQKQRAALVGELSEADAVHNGRDLWTYTSDSNTVSHTTLRRPADAQQHPSTLDITPAAVARKLLAAVTPSTDVSVDSTRMVAGRAAYTLSLAPKAASSTIKRVSIAIDATKHIPLQVQVFGSGSKPAFEIGFDSISFTKPAASTFRFTTPAGASTTDNPVTSDGRHGNGRITYHGRSVPAGAGGMHGVQGYDALDHMSRPADAPKVIGSGWTTVVRLPQSAAGQLTSGLGRDATTSIGSNGDRVLRTALVNVLITSDGTAYAGAVTTSYLQHVAAAN